MKSSSASRTHLLDLGMTAVVTAVALAFALSMFTAYFENPGGLWRNLESDRASHYLFGLDLAVALRTLDPLGFLVRLEQVRDWVPLHPLVLGLILGVGGIDHRLGILPGLAGWVLTIVLTWLITRRLFVDRIPGIVAGTIAVTFAVASPQFRAISADVMLEGLGAGLTALALWLYMRARDMPHDDARWRALAIVLTLLFLQKQNYWLLTVVSLALAHVSEAPRDWLARGRGLIAGVDFRRAVLSGIRDPLLVAVAAICVAVLIIVLNGPRPFEFFGRSVSLYPPRNPLTVAWALLLIRLGMSWYRNRAAFDAQLGNIGRAMFYWQAVPIALFLVLPHRLQYFLMYVSTTNAFPFQHFDPWLGARYYIQILVQEYHVGLWSALIAIPLALVGLRQLGRLAPAALAPAALLVVSAIAVVLHPNANYRYLASWIFTFWIFAGAGAVFVVQRTMARLSARAGPVVAGLMIGALVIPHVGAALSPTDVVARRATDNLPSELDLAAAYLPAIGDARHVGFVLSFGPHHFATWTVRERCRCRAVVEWPLAPVASLETIRQTVEDWIKRTPAQRIVVIDTYDQHERVDVGLTRFHAIGMFEAMANQRRFERIETIWIPSYPAEVSIWSRATGEPAPREGKR
jgi:hypothetical protein